MSLDTRPPWLPSMETVQLGMGPEFGGGLQCYRNHGLGKYTASRRGQAASAPLAEEPALSESDLYLEPDRYGLFPQTPFQCVVMPATEAQLSLGADTPGTAVHVVRGKVTT